MPLKSRHFSGNSRLEGCLIRNTDHVKRGDRGDHVLKIQQAVVILSGEAISLEELEQMHYGPSTATAVLAYKRLNSIVNFSYQTSPDDIVGMMTISALDEGMTRFEAQLALRAPPVALSHPQSPVQRGTISRTPRLRRRGFHEGQTIEDTWEFPVSSWPDDLKATLVRSNALRTRDNDYLAPIIPWGDDRKSLKELSGLLANSPEPTSIVRDVYNRMSKFGVWPHISAIRNIYNGIGSRGFFADAVDCDAFLRDMKFLTRFRSVLEWAFKLARFCQDIGNVHGPRDTFREVVPIGPGLHICITQPVARHDTPCDIHIDNFQQGNIVVCGHCVPTPNISTVAHIISVSPWLIDRANEARKYLEKRAWSPTSS